MVLNCAPSVSIHILSLPTHFCKFLSILGNCEREADYFTPDTYKEVIFDNFNEYINFYTTLVCEEYDIFISCSSKKAFNFKTKCIYSLDENLHNNVGSKLITHKDNSISVYI